MFVKISHARSTHVRGMVDLKTVLCTSIVLLYRLTAWRHVAHLINIISLNNRNFISLFTRTSWSECLVAEFINILYRLLATWLCLAQLMLISALYANFHSDTDSIARTDNILGCQHYWKKSSLKKSLLKASNFLCQVQRDSMTNTVQKSNKDKRLCYR